MTDKIHLDVSKISELIKNKTELFGYMKTRPHFYTTFKSFLVYGFDKPTYGIKICLDGDFTTPALVTTLHENIDDQETADIILDDFLYAHKNKHTVLDKKKGEKND